MGRGAGARAPGSYARARARRPRAGATLIVADTSVAVAAFASWHTFHDAARAAVRRGARLPAHAALETYSVLTRLPAEQRVPGHVVVEFLERNFEQPFLSLRPKSVSTLLGSLPGRGITGGASYDALIAAIAASVKGRLATLDLRAARTYEVFDLDVEYLGAR